MKKIIIKKEKETPKKDEFKVKLSYNGIVEEFKTNDLKEIATKIGYFDIKTNLLINITKDKLSCERFLLLKQAKLLLRNNISLELFINRLIFK